MTHNDDAYRLLAEYAAENLTESERTQLANAALADPAVFAALVEEENWREALEDNVFRRRVKERLRQLGAEKEPYWTRLVHYLLSPRGMLSAGGALAAVTVTVLVQFGVFRSSPALIQVNLGPSNVPASAVASLASEPLNAESALRSRSHAQPPPKDSHAVLQLDRPGRSPVYQVGDHQRIGFRLEQDANVVLWEERADGGSFRLFPNRFQSSPFVEAGKTALIPPAGQGDLAVQAPAGPRVLRLLIFPPNRNPLDGQDSWDRLRQEAREVRLVYEVEQRQ
jgi:hypothetical protein